MCVKDFKRGCDLVFKTCLLLNKPIFVSKTYQNEFWAFSLVSFDLWFLHSSLVSNFDCQITCAIKLDTFIFRIYTHTHTLTENYLMDRRILKTIDFYYTLLVFLYEFMIGGRASMHQMHDLLIKILRYISGNILMRSVCISGEIHFWFIT